MLFIKHNHNFFKNRTRPFLKKKKRFETYIECYDKNLGLCKSLSNATPGTKSKGQERKGVGVSSFIAQSIKSPHKPLRNELIGVLVESGVFTDVIWRNQYGCLFKTYNWTLIDNQSSLLSWHFIKTSTFQQFYITLFFTGSEGSFLWISDWIWLYMYMIVYTWLYVLICLDIDSNWTY